MATFDSTNPFRDIKFRGQTNSYFMVRFGYPRFSEVDAYQVMWNGHYINYFETSRLYYGKYMNVSTKLFEEYGFQVPVYSYQVNMRNPITANEEIEVGVRPVSFRKGLIDLFHVILGNGEIKAVGNIVHAVVERETRSIPYPMPDIVYEIVGRFFKPFEKQMEWDSRARELSLPLET